MVAVLLVLAGPALPAGAAPPVLCSALMAQDPTGWLHGATVQGDLVADAGCRAAATTVTGDVVVPPGGSLDGHSLAVHGAVRAEGPVWLWESRVHRDVTLAVPGAGGLTLAVSWVGGEVRGTAGHALLQASTVLGDVALTAREAVRVRDSVLGGAVDATGGRLLVHRSAVGGDVTSTGALDVLVCDAAVRGGLTVTAVRGWSRVGQEGGAPCRTTVGGDLRVLDNPHSVVLDDLQVGGDLECTGNTGPQLVVRTGRLAAAGTRTGQCA